MLLKRFDKHTGVMEPAFICDMGDTDALLCNTHGAAAAHRYTAKMKHENASEIKRDR